MTDDAAAEPFAHVVHVQLRPDEDPRLDRLRGRRALVVLWSGDRPVGQVLLHPDEDPVRAVGTARETRAATEPSRPGTRGTVSLVICTRDRPEELARCLAGVSHQTRPADEVIVVDNASRGPGTREAASTAGVRYVREDRPGLDVARNTGLLAARGDIVAFTDDDTQPHPRWLERLEAAFDTERVMAVTGLVLPSVLDTEPQWVFETEWGFGRGFQRRDFGPAFYRATRGRGTPVWELGAGANMAFRRTVYAAVGLFDERLGAGAAGCGDDSEYWYRILAAGWTCRYEPSAVVFHHHRARPEELRNQIYAYMRGHVAALLVQYERTGDLGNLRRAFLTLPAWYARRAAALALHGRGGGNDLLWTQIRGAGAGVLYYLRNRRAVAMRRGPSP